MDDIEELLTDTRALVKDTVARGLAEGLAPDQVAAALEDAFVGKARPVQIAPPSPALDLPALVTAIAAALGKAETFHLGAEEYSAALTGPQGGDMSIDRDEQGRVVGVRVNDHDMERRTVIDRDSVTGAVVGYHTEPLGR